jgi:hypothetical protein
LRSAKTAVEGIPQIPTSLARTIKRYTGAYGLPLAGWNTTKREVWLKNITGSSASLYRVATPGDTAQPFIALCACIDTVTYAIH